MRMLKIFIAYDATYKIVLAEQLQPDSQQTYICTSCDSTLTLCSPPNQNPWFSNDLSSTSVEQLRSCTYSDPEAKSNERLSKLRTMVQTLAPVVPNRDWYCHWCSETHIGEKRCPQCKTDIYCQQVQSEVWVFRWIISAQERWLASIHQRLDISPYHSLVFL